MAIHSSSVRASELQLLWGTQGVGSGDSPKHETQGPFSIEAAGGWVSSVVEEPGKRQTHVKQQSSYIRVFVSSSVSTDIIKLAGPIISLTLLSECRISLRGRFRVWDGWGGGVDCYGTVQGLLGFRGWEVPPAGVTCHPGLLSWRRADNGTLEGQGRLCFRLLKEDVLHSQDQSETESYHLFQVHTGRRRRETKWCISGLLHRSRKQANNIFMEWVSFLV